MYVLTDGDMDGLAHGLTINVVSEDGKRDVILDPNNISGDDMEALYAGETLSIDGFQIYYPS